MATLLRAARGPAVIGVLAAAAGEALTVPVIADRSRVHVGSVHGLLRHYERQGLVKGTPGDVWQLTDRGVFFARRRLAQRMAALSHE